MQIRIILMLMTALLLTNCASYDFSRRIVQQGNLLPKDKIQRLQIGMSKKEAAILMGTSLVSPVFNDNRWDYAYTWREANGPLEKKSISLFFVNGKLARIDRQA